VSSSDVQSFAQLICGPIFGAVLGFGSRAERLGRFPYAIVLAAGMVLLSTLAILGARWKRVGWQVMVKT
jgi:hypothetical protein